MTSHTLLSAVRKGQGDIFAVSIGELEVIFSLPSCKQALQYAQTLSFIADDDPMKPSMYEFIFQAHAEDSWLANHKEDMPAGVPESIARLILLLSGAEDRTISYTQELIESYRQIVPNNTMFFMKRIICGAFGGYTLQMLDELNYQELVGTFIQAEQYLLESGIIEERYNYGTAESLEETKHEPINFDQLMTDNRELQKAENAIAPELRQKRWS